LPSATSTGDDLALENFLPILPPLSWLRRRENDPDRLKLPLSLLLESLFLVSDATESESAPPPVPEDEDEELLRELFLLSSWSR
jgi:hypothetical protein